MWRKQPESARVPLPLAKIVSEAVPPAIPESAIGVPSSHRETLSPTCQPASAISASAFSATTAAPRIRKFVCAVQPRDIFVRFITTDGCSVQAVDLNLDRTLGPRVPVTSPENLRRLLAYLGANREALHEYNRCHRSHGQGNVRITLQPGRKNLLRLSDL
jgi:hypothetical protein